MAFFIKNSDRGILTFLEGISTLGKVGDHQLEQPKVSKYLVEQKKSKQKIIFLTV